MENDTFAILNLFRTLNLIQSQVIGALPRGNDRIAGSFSLRHAKAMMTVVLRDHEGKPPLTLGALGKALCLKKAAASILVSELVEKRLLCRTVDKDNRRYVRISLGSRGRRLGHDATSRAAERIGHLLGLLTPAERRIFVRAARKINDGFAREIGED